MIGERPAPLAAPRQLRRGRPPEDHTERGGEQPAHAAGGSRRRRGHSGHRDRRQHPGVRDPPPRRAGGLDQPVHERRGTFGGGRRRRHQHDRRSRETERRHERQADQRPAARHARGRHRDQRPPRQVGQEPDAEPGPVQEREHGHREERPPPVGDLTARLRDRDPEPGGLGHRIPTGHRCDEEEPGGAEGGPEQGAERPEGRAEHGRRQRRTEHVQAHVGDPAGAASPVHHGGDGLHHRQASGTEQRRQPGDDGGGDHRDRGRAGQHRIRSCR